MSSRSSSPFGLTQDGKAKCRYCELAAVLWVTESDDSKSPCCAFHYDQQTSKQEK